MAEKILKSRIVNKRDIEANWLKAETFVPKAGEIIVYGTEIDKDGQVLQLPEGRTEPYTYERFKIGDGIKTVTELPFTADINNPDGTSKIPSKTSQLENDNGYVQVVDNDSNIIFVEGQEGGLALGANEVTISGSDIDVIADDINLSSKAGASIRIGGNQQGDQTILFLDGDYTEITARDYLHIGSMERVNVVAGPSSAMILSPNQIDVFSKMDMQSHKISGVSNPEANTDAANKAYVDSAIEASIQRIEESITAALSTEV